MSRTVYDAAVVGGGAAAVFCAYALAAEGSRVVLLADGGSLMQEIGWSRLPVLEAHRLALEYEPFRTWLELLYSRQGVKGDSFEPVLSQLLADRFALEQGIDVWFEVKPVQLEFARPGGQITGVRVATREGVDHVRCRTVVDCSENAVLMRSVFPATPIAESDVHAFWTLTTLNGERMKEPVELVYMTNGSRNRIRIAPSFWEGELSITVAVSSTEAGNREEIAFLAGLERLFAWMRAHAGLEIGDLVHVAERCWETPSFVLQGDVAGPSGGWLEACSGQLCGVGVWTPAIEAAIREAPLWDKGGTAASRMIEQALGAAKQIHAGLKNGIR